MTLRPLSDISAADWFVGTDVRELGPPGFEAYARVLHPWQESATDTATERADGYLPDDELASLCDVLARHTATPEQCFFGLWDGYGDIYGGDSVAFLTTFTGSPRWPGPIFSRPKPPAPPPPAFPPSVLNGPRLSLPNRDFLLFTGPLAQAGDWGAIGYGPAIPRDLNSPNLAWPADHSWFFATEIDGEWTGVGGSAAMIDELVQDDRLEVVRTHRDNSGDLP